MLDTSHIAMEVASSGFIKNAAGQYPSFTGAHEVEGGETILLRNRHTGTQVKVKAQSSTAMPSEQELEDLRQNISKAEPSLITNDIITSSLVEEDRSSSSSPSSSSSSSSSSSRGWWNLLTGPTAAQAPASNSNLLSASSSSTIPPSASTTTNSNNYTSNNNTNNNTTNHARIIVDWANKSYSFSRYPPLAFLLGRKWFIPLGCLLIAACAQIQFFFPCTLGYATINFKGDSYCVPTESVALVTATSCPADICSKRIPVTMQTFAVLLNGCLGGQTTGVYSTLLYVVLVCLGAPFGAGGKVEPVWENGAILSPTGGFLWGFIAATAIMGRCAEHGHDRLHSIWRLVLWMFAAEAAMYSCGLFWLPFGLALKSHISVSKICTDAGSCLKNIFAWGFLPFIPGDLFKMALVALVVPVRWKLFTVYHQKKSGYRVQTTSS